MDLGLKAKGALIVGGSAGMGAATARVLAQEGARLAICAPANDALDAVVAELGAEAFGVPADVTQPGEAEAAVKAAAERLGRLDILVISIGAAQGGPFCDLDDGVWERAFSLKMMGMVRLLRAAAPIMAAQGSGSIVVVVGNNGKQPQARLAPGSAVNAACLAIVKSLADELAPSGVRVNAVNPGPTRTDRWDTLMAGLSARSGRTVAEEEAAQFAQIPLGRINEADEMGRLIALIASDLSATMTGSSITADGGATKGIA